MELFGDIAPLLLAATEGGAGAEEEGGSFLVEPALGLMLWTLLAFGVTVFVLAKVAFPRISKALEERANRVSSELDAAERQRKEADELLAEYRARLTEAREQADDIMARARKAADHAKEEAASEGATKRSELVDRAKRDIEAETRRSLDAIRKEVAELTVLATERVTRKSLSAEDQQRLVEEALSEVDFSSLAGESPSEQ